MEFFIRKEIKHMKIYKLKRNQTFVIFLLLNAMSFAPFSIRQSFAQDTKTKIFLETLAEAEAKTKAKEWNNAALLWEKVVGMNPVDGRYWNKLATVFYNAKNYRKAISAYEKSIELGFGNPANSTYNIASNYGMLNEKEKALEWLEKALEMGFLDLEHSRKDEDFQVLKDDPRFRNLVGKIDTSKMSRTEGWRTDLQFLVKEIKRRRYSSFDIKAGQKFDDEVKALHDDIPKLSDAQLDVRLMKLLVKVGDGHSTFYGDIMSNSHAATLPVKFYLFEEGLYIIAADPKYRHLLGSQVLEIGGHPIQKVIQTLEPIISRDNQYWIKQVAPYFMRDLWLLNGLDLIPDTQKVSLNIRTLEGEKKLIDLESEAKNVFIWNTLPNPPEWINFPQTLKKHLPLYLKNMGAKYWFQYLPESKTIYFQFNLIRNDEQESFAKFTERLFKFINEKTVEKLVIDLRWNNGGNTGLLPPLIHGLIKNEKINQRGKLFVITGRRTFSAAQNASTFIERETNAIFVGEPTGASPNFVGEEEPFQLPYSKSLVNVSNLYWQSSDPTDRRTWIAPLIYLPPTFKAYRENRDLVLEEILDYTGEIK